VFTTFLNVKGKILFDAIIAKPLIANQREDDMEYWIDVSGADAEAAIKHLKVSCFKSDDF
jgi:folate-binding Fe-S cluster repair protein YgfZ